MMYSVGRDDRNEHAGEHMDRSAMSETSVGSSPPKTAPYMRIATEEAFTTADVLSASARALEDHLIDEPGFYSHMGYYLHSTSERAVGVMRRLQDIGAGRLQDMDDTGIALQILSLAHPGVQIFDAPTAIALARSANDELSEAIQKHPDRFAGLAAIAPQAPDQAAQELARSVSNLGLKGAIINSHTQGEYLDDSKFWPIFEAAESLDVPIYLHPTNPPASMIGPFLERGLDAALYGFAVETSVHVLRLIIAGVFDRFPRLQIVIGHLGEGLPFWLYRLDYMHAAFVRSKRYENVGPLQKKVSDYLKENFYITSSGMPWEPAVMFTRSVMGKERVMYAMDYPYQFSLEEVELSDALPLSPAEMKDFYQSIAQKVFRLDGAN